MLKRALISVLMIFILQACTSIGTRGAHTPTVDTSHQAETAGSIGWHSVAFRINWPENGAPAWHVDAFLAHTVCRDSLNIHGDKMLLWRFHRRAIRDPAGHRFSFKFYGDQAMASAVYREIENHPQTRQLLLSGIVTNIISSPLDGNELPEVADTSDPGWSPPLRASWPYFAMGTSQSWLALIDQVVQSSQPESDSDSDSLGARLAFYKSVNDQVTQYWRHEGNHAYLHHLNALFGYEEIVVRGNNITRF